MVSAYFADVDDITSQINHICNRSPANVFSPVGDTSESADKRYSDGAIESARRMAAHKIFSAIGSNPSHPYWGQLKTDVPVANGGVIPPYYGEIGVPQISVNGGTYRNGYPADGDEIDSWRNDESGTFSNFYGTEDDQAYNETTDPDDVMSPMALKYNTGGGVLVYTGSNAKIPMIAVPGNLSDAEDMADNKIPFNLAALNVKLALPLLVKEGDNLFRTAAFLGQQGENELLQVAGGAVKVQPIDVAKAIQLSQRAT